jgi:hypothetical protein
MFLLEELGESGPIGTTVQVRLSSEYLTSLWPYQQRDPERVTIAEIEQKLLAYFEENILYPPVTVLFESSSGKVRTAQALEAGCDSKAVCRRLFSGPEGDAEAYHSASLTVAVQFCRQPHRYEIRASRFGILFERAEGGIIELAGLLFPGERVVIDDRLPDSMLSMDRSILRCSATGEEAVFELEAFVRALCTWSPLRSSTTAKTPAPAFKWFSRVSRAASSMSLLPIRQVLATTFVEISSFVTKNLPCVVHTRHADGRVKSDLVTGIGCILERLRSIPEERWAWITVPLKAMRYSVAAGRFLLFDHQAVLVEIPEEVCDITKGAPELCSISDEQRSLAEVLAPNRWRDVEHEKALHFHRNGKQHQALPHYVVSGDLGALGFPTPVLGVDIRRRGCKSSSIWAERSREPTRDLRCAFIVLDERHPLIKAFLMANPSSELAKVLALEICGLASGRNPSGGFKEATAALLVEAGLAEIGTDQQRIIMM